MAKITVVERENDWKAFLNDNDQVWEIGNTSAEAIGKLVFYRKEELDIEVDIKCELRFCHFDYLTGLIEFKRIGYEQEQNSQGQINQT